MEYKIFKRIFEWLFCVLLALVMALAIRYYIIAPSMVNQKSMMPTLKEGERILISRIQRLTQEKYVRGQIIVFQAPIEELNRNLSDPRAKYNSESEKLLERFAYNVLELNKITYVKRIIGIPGDRIKIENRNVYVNEELLEENYLALNSTTENVFYNYVIVPEGYVFVMGDNRNESMDSRKFGCIPIDKIEGIVKFRYWPLNKFGKIE